MYSNNNITIIFILLILCVSSCTDFLGGDVNRDGDKPSSVPLTAMLPNVQIVLADATGGSFSRFNCLFVQQVEGVERQWSSINQYGITPNRFDAAWQNIYENSLVELNVMQKQAIEGENNHYLGVINVLKAYTLMMATDVWGDIPYTEALKGVEALNPNYDDQETIIYPEIISLLSDAIILFEKDSGPLQPGVEDVYYSGDISKWTKAAYALKSRAHLHLGQYNDALNHALNSFESPDDNLSFVYSTSAASPWFRFNRDRTGDIQFHPTMRDLMLSLNDTDRLEIYSADFSKHDSHPYMIAAFEQELISFREIQFIIAESLIKTGGSASSIREAYLSGISASFREVGLDNDSYITYTSQAVVDPGTGNITLEHIITQKYIGLFVQPEVFSDWRRTGIPALTPVSGSSIPVRWLYSSDEYLFNSNSPSENEVTLFTPKVDWDKD